ncbi:MAG: polyprenol monophosphomannose synthase [Candidatus Niyogibacteria bacterium]|nr:polyprenol monophosphomannose synthase [Candidatus Niyogibacteria bacterium]
MEHPRVCIITPTYNERENVKALIEQVLALGIANMRIVVIDDNSPDGTGKIAEELARKHPITVIHQPEKTGLGRAYVKGFLHVCALPVGQQPDFIIQMDADLSHDPAVIPDMLRYIKNHDVVIGSRYVPGGIIKNWSLDRRLLSRFGNMYARIILRLPYRDVTAGFKCYRRSVVERMNMKTLDSVGYNFQIETTYRAHRAGFSIQEIPITFTERKKGVSKINFFIIMESFLKVLLLPFQKKAGAVRDRS